MLPTFVPRPAYSGSGTLFVWLAAWTVPAIVVGAEHLRATRALRDHSRIGVCADRDQHVPRIARRGGSCGIRGISLQAVIVIASSPPNARQPTARARRRLLVDERPPADPDLQLARPPIRLRVVPRSTLRRSRRAVAAGHQATLFCAAVPGRPERETVDGVATRVAAAVSRCTGTHDGST
jgi:hypothetical protein